MLKKILMSGQSHHILPLIASTIRDYHKTVSSILIFHRIQFKVDGYHTERNIQQNLWVEPIHQFQH